MIYDRYAYMFPPRPETKIPVAMLGYYQRKGFVAQVKKNGTCTVIFANKDHVIYKTRHDDDHKLWTPLSAHTEFFKRDAQKGWNVYCAELLHSKTSHIKNQLYIFDQLVEDGISLEGTTFEDRQLNLHSRWEPVTDEGDQNRVHPLISVAINFTDNFKEKYKSLKKEDEGLVLKDPKAKLKGCYKALNNTQWQVKCRILHENYAF